MEYFEFLNEFLNENSIDSTSIPIVIELLEISRDIAFLLADNSNIKESYLKDNYKELRNTFIKTQIEELSKSISNLNSLKSVTEENNTKIANLLIESNEKALRTLNNILSFPNTTNESLVFKHENNRKRMLLNLNKARELKENLKRNNKANLLQNLNKLILDLLNTYRFGPNPSLNTIKEQIEKEYNVLDIEYLKNINESTIEQIIKDKETITNKDDALKYLNKLYNLNSNHQKPIINDSELLRIRELEERIYSLNLMNYLEKSENNEELKTYNVLLKGQLEVLYLEVDSKEKRVIYLNTLSNMLNTINSLNEKLKPLRVSNGIFDYSVDFFDSVKTIKTDGSRKWIRYKKGTINNYSLIENREVITRELDYWKKQINSGFDRYDKGEFYKQVEETFNFIKLYYKYRSYIMYLEVSNKLFNFNDSTKLINKDKKKLDELRDYLMNKVADFRIKGIPYYKKEIDPEKYFSKYSLLERKVIMASIIPKDGIGRCIESYEMLKIIYGEEYVKDNINAFEKATKK